MNANPLIALMRDTRLKRYLVNIGLTLPAFVLLFFFAQNNTTADVSPNSDDVAAAIASLIATKQNPLLTQPDFSAQAEQVSALYRMHADQLLWLGENRSESLIDDALKLLRNASADGLDPLDYDTEVLTNDFKMALAMPRNAITELTKFDTALSIALVRFINDLHHGRVKPRQLNYPSQFGNKQNIDSANLIKQAISAGTLAQLAETAAPRIRQYQQLKKALHDYRQRPRETRGDPLVLQKSLRPGDRHPQIAELRERLIAWDALPANAGNPNDTDDRGDLYSETLEAGVKEFQRQNGLQADGIIGRETATKLNQSLEHRIHQIELAMERLRWLPDNLSGPLIIVNIPAFQLWAFSSPEVNESLNMKVIVGKALQNQTPVLFEEMKYLEFMPYWNIPTSIMKKEILPKLYNDWSYLQSQDIELIQVYRSDAESWDGIFEDIRRGRVRARQRPGKKNPLGKVKFIFPNKEDVYLHDTSTPSLFNRSRRDFSHGCVRVEDAERLAEFVLSHQPDTNWDLSAIQQAMSGSKTRRVSLKNTIPVLFLYSTAFVDHDNQVHFYSDIYEHDATLAKTLGKLPLSDNDKVLTAGGSAPG